jgi:hypothetical protein
MIGEQGSERDTHQSAPPASPLAPGMFGADARSFRHPASGVTRVGTPNELVRGVDVSLSLLCRPFKSCATSSGNVMVAVPALEPRQLIKQSLIGQACGSDPRVQLLLHESRAFRSRPLASAPEATPQRIAAAGQARLACGVAKGPSRCTRVWRDATYGRRVRRRGRPPGVGGRGLGRV